MKIGIIGAMPIEVEALKNIMDDVKISKFSGVDFYEGTLSEVPVVVAVAGVGKVNAALCAQTMILAFEPTSIINIGVAGGLSPELKVGDIAIATEVVEHDMDTSSLGDPLGYISGIDIVYIPCTKWISDLLYNVSCDVADVKSKINEFPSKAIKGVIASGDQFISGQEQRNHIINNFNAVAAEMEGASIGHVCYMNNVDFGVLRAISDSADEEASLSFVEFTKLAVKNSVAIVLEFLKRTREQKQINKIQSFCVDHTKLQPGMYISRVDSDIVTYDLRVKKPNSGDLINNVQMHTLEHMFATYVRNSDISDDVIYFGPMGCQTGFYLLVRSDVSSEKVLQTTKNILEQTLAYNGEVFGASEIECGNYRTLELEEAKTVCREYTKILKTIDKVKSYSEI